MYWACQCDCSDDSYTVVKSSNLKGGSVKSCGCANIAIQSNDLTGQVFGRLTVLGRSENKNGRVYWKCQCCCENKTIIEVRTDGLTGKDNSTHQATRSCGCLAKEHAIKIGHDNYGKLVDDLTGKTFDKLTVIKRNDIETSKEPHWLCKCSCNNTCIKSSAYLKKSIYCNCGCEHGSKGEIIINHLLSNAKIPFIQEYSNDSCRFQDTKALAKFDFYVQNKYVIEFDGLQHFEYKNDNGWNTEEHFKKVQEHDAIKTKWCKDNNIPLIRIPYTHLKDLCIEDLLLETTKFLVE